MGLTSFKTVEGFCLSVSSNCYVHPWESGPPEQGRCWKNTHVWCFFFPNLDLSMSELAVVNKHSHIITTCDYDYDNDFDYDVFFCSVGQRKIFIRCIGKSRLLEMTRSH